MRVLTVIWLQQAKHSDHDHDVALPIMQHSDASEMCLPRCHMDMDVERTIRLGMRMVRTYSTFFTFFYNVLHSCLQYLFTFYYKFLH